MLTSRKQRYGAALLLAAAALSGCGLSDPERSGHGLSYPWDPEGSGETGRWPGQTKFQSAAPWMHIFRPLLATAEQQRNEASRIIEESDIFKVAGDRLYVLNPTRGLVVIDVQNPDQPTIIGRAPVAGNPVEMYLRGDFALVLLNSTYNWGQWDRGSAGAALFVIDLSDPTGPAPIGPGLPIDGWLVDSRIVGNVLYAVSTQSSYDNGDSTTSTLVQSFSVGSKDGVQQIETAAIPGIAGNVIHVTQDYVFIATGDQPSTEVRAVNIMDPNGRMFVGDAAKVYGVVQDRLMMSYDEDESELRVISHLWDEAGQGDIWVQKYDVNRAATSLTQTGALLLDNVGQITAARFDDHNDRAYLVHLERIDPIDIIDMSGPEDPTLLDRIDIPGWIEHLEPRGNRLIGIGVDQAGGPAPTRSCPGYEYEPLPEDTRKLAAVLYDTTGDVLCEAARVRFGQGNWAWSGGFYDERAIRLLDEQGLLLVPFDEWASDDGQSISAVQMIDVFLTHPASPGGPGTLALRGRLENLASVNRAFLLAASDPIDPTFTTLERLAALSSRQLVVADITNRDEPTVTRRLEIARNIVDFKPLGNSGYGVQSVGEWNEDGELRVVDIGTPDADRDPDGRGITSIRAPAGQLFVDGNIVTVVSTVYDQQQSWVRIATFDVSDPVSPLARGSIRLPAGGGFGPWARFASVSGVVQPRRNLLVVSSYEQNGDTSYAFVSTANPDQPEITGRRSQGTGKIAFDVKTFWGDAFLVTYAPVDGPAPELPGPFVLASPDDATAPLDSPVLPATKDYVRYYVTRVTFDSDGSPNIGKAINVPGRLVDVSQDQRVWTLLDSRWTADSGDQTKALFTVEVKKPRFRNLIRAGRVELIDGYAVDPGVDSALVRGDYAYYTSFDTWRGPIILPAELGAETIMPPQEPMLHLVVLELLDRRRISLASAIVVEAGEGGSLLEVRQVGSTRYAFIGMYGGGVSIIDVTRAESPVLRQFVRTETWPYNLTVSPENGAAYIASGLWGVQEIRLEQATVGQCLGNHNCGPGQTCQLCWGIWQCVPGDWQC